MNYQSMLPKKVIKIILPIVSFLFIFIKAAQVAIPGYSVKEIISSFSGIIYVVGFMSSGFLLSLFLSAILTLCSYYLFIKKENRSKDKFKDILVFVTVFIWLVVSMVQYY